MALSDLFTEIFQGLLPDELGDEERIVVVIDRLIDGLKELIILDDGFETIDLGFWPADPCPFGYQNQAFEDGLDGKAHPSWQGNAPGIEEALHYKEMLVVLFDR